MRVLFQGFVSPSLPPSLRIYRGGGAVSGLFSPPSLPPSLPPCVITYRGGGADCTDGGHGRDFAGANHVLLGGG